jgi:hypothetical protein
MSIPIGTKPPKQKSKTHLQKKTYITKKELAQSTFKLNNEQ